MKFNQDSQDTLNAYILICFLYLGSITLPIKILTGSGIVVWGSTLILVFMSLFINKFSINRKALFLSIVLIFVFLINIMLVDFKAEANVIFLEFLKFGVIPFILASYVKDYKKLITAWYHLAVINLIIWMAFLSNVNSGELNYMNFGIYMTYCFMVFLYYSYTLRGAKKILNNLLMFTTLIIIVMLANRVSILICLVVFAVFEIKNLKVTRIKDLLKSLLYISLTVFISLNFQTLIIELGNLLSKFGINSYSLNKFIYMLDTDLVTASSGRDDLATGAISLINMSHGMPNGVGYYQFMTGEIYPHNIFLDILLIFGYFGILIFLVVFIYIVSVMITNKSPHFSFLIWALTIFVFIRLNFSGTFLTELPLWMLLSLIIFKRESKGGIEKYD